MMISSSLSCGLAKKLTCSCTVSRALAKIMPSFHQWQQPVTGSCQTSPCLSPWKGRQLRS
uniref:Alternative protein POLR1C n=1 Tax=Homo sapiens TaxID=9606 RepID=L8ECB7_HUMAN|nr:alternative protein POLR1C [Homo sapiens]